MASLQSFLCFDLLGEYREQSENERGDDRKMFGR